MKSSSRFSAQRLILPLYLLPASFIFGTVGYYLVGLYGARNGIIEKAWSFGDCAFMTAISLTTVGFGDWLGIANYPFAQAYTIFLIFAGMGVVLFAVSELTSFFVEGNMKHILERRRLMKSIKELRDHVIVCGLGNAGFAVLQELSTMEVPFVGLESDEDRYEWLQEHFPDALILQGDAMDEEFLAEAGIEHAAGMLACLSDAKDNLFVTVTARSLNPNLKIVARAETPAIATKLRAGGASRVVTPSFTGGLRMVSELLRPTVVSFLDTMMRDSGNHRFSEVIVPQDSSLVEKRLAETHIGDRTGLNLIAVRSVDGAYHYNVKGDHVIHAGDTLVTVGSPAMNKQLEDLVREKK